VLGFKNGKEIVDFFSSSNHPKIDVILMDIKMPVMDGYEAARLIKDKHPEIPIIAQTAYALVEDIEKIKKASFDAYLVKPIKPGHLVEKIMALIFP
jgi:CheY-like chemotaxis protein